MFGKRSSRDIEKILRREGGVKSPEKRAALIEELWQHARAGRGLVTVVDDLLCDSDCEPSLDKANIEALVGILEYSAQKKLRDEWYAPALFRSSKITPEQRARVIRAFLLPSGETNENFHVYHRTEFISGVLRRDVPAEMQDFLLAQLHAILDETKDEIPFAFIVQIYTEGLLKSPEARRELERYFRRIVDLNDDELRESVLKNARFLPALPDDLRIHVAKKIYAAPSSPPSPEEKEPEAERLHPVMEQCGELVRSEFLKEIGATARHDPIGALKACMDILKTKLPVETDYDAAVKFIEDGAPHGPPETRVAAASVLTETAHLPQAAVSRLVTLLCQGAEVCPGPAFIIANRLLLNEEGCCKTGEPDRQRLRGLQCTLMGHADPDVKAEAVRACGDIMARRFGLDNGGVLLAFMKAAFGENGLFSGLEKDSAPETPRTPQGPLSSPG